MALGEVLGEARGKVAGLRALGDGIIEVSLQGKGTLLGSEMEDVTTFGSVMRPNGTAYGQGNSIQCVLKVWQSAVVLGLADLQGPVLGSTLMALYIQLLHLRNGRDCSMFTLQANMKMTQTEITSGNSGNGNSDILKEELITRSHHLFIPISMCVLL